MDPASRHEAVARAAFEEVILTTSTAKKLKPARKYCQLLPQQDETWEAYMARLQVMPAATRRQQATEQVAAYSRLGERKHGQNVGFNNTPLHSRVVMSILAMWAPIPDQRPMPVQLTELIQAVRASSAESKAAKESNEGRLARKEAAETEEAAIDAEAEQASNAAATTTTVQQVSTDKPVGNTAAKRARSDITQCQQHRSVLGRLGSRPTAGSRNVRLPPSKEAGAGYPKGAGAGDEGYESDSQGDALALASIESASAMSGHEELPTADSELHSYWMSLQDGTVVAVQRPRHQGLCICVHASHVVHRAHTCMAACQLCHRCSTTNVSRCHGRRSV